MHTCIIYGLNGAGSRLIVTVPDTIPQELPDAPASFSVRIETILHTSPKAKRAPFKHTGLKPVNGTKLALR